MPDAKDHVPSVEPASTTLLDLSEVGRKTKNMKDRELVIPAGSYQASPTTLGLPVIVEVAKAECAGHDQPSFMETGDYSGEPNTVTARPVLQANKSTVPCRWDENGVPFIDSLPIIIAKDILIPEDTNVSIPISRKTLANGQEVVLLHLGQLKYTPVEKGKRSKKGAGQERAPSSNAEETEEE
jgi:hypothetical protein